MNNWVKARWLCWRILYRLGLFAIFYGIVSVWPNYLTFGKFRGPEPVDFVPYVNRVCVPLIRAIKEYEIDTGVTPDDYRLSNLVPNYVDSIPADVSWDYPEFYFRDVEDYDHTITTPAIIHLTSTIA